MAAMTEVFYVFGSVGILHTTAVNEVNAGNNCIS